MPDQEAEFLTPASQLLAKQQELQEVEEALNSEKEVLIGRCLLKLTNLQAFQLNMDSLQQRREELERKEQELANSLLKFDKFLKENEVTACR